MPEFCCSATRPALRQRGHRLKFCLEDKSETICQSQEVFSNQIFDSTWRNNVGMLTRSNRSTTRRKSCRSFSPEQEFLFRIQRREDGQAKERSCHLGIMSENTWSGSTKTIESCVATDGFYVHNMCKRQIHQDNQSQRRGR